MTATDSDEAIQTLELKVLRMFGTFESHMRARDKDTEELEAKVAALTARVTMLEAVKAGRMSEHDRIRWQRALACDRDNLESLNDAIVGLQSTDAPELLTLHDELMALAQALVARKNAGPVSGFVEGERTLPNVL